tara:strand:+ start:177 stop:617 length:441 start_codon:yes stop_codon:yes gene_type:complete
MKDIEIIYLNDEHEQIIEGYLIVIKKLMYFATENTETGKYQDFLTILNSIYLYSNNFYATMINKSNIEKGAVAEFLFLIPNMLFYTSIGFLTALKDGKNDSELKNSLEEIGFNCENITSELADVLIDEAEKKEILKDIFNNHLTNN